MASRGSFGRITLLARRTGGRPAAGGSVIARDLNQSSAVDAQDLTTIGSA
jgi:hypothetical protein